MNLLKQNHVKYGLILTAVLAVCLLLMETTGDNETFENKSPIFLVYQFIAPAVVWYLGLKAKREMQKGKLTFKEGLKEGFKMSVVFGITSPFVFGAYYLFINPGIVEYVAGAYGLTDTSDNMVIMVDMLVQFIAAIIFGTIYAAVIAKLVRSK